MGEYLDQIPEHIQNHVRQITKSSGLPDSEDSVEEIARAWTEKSEVFSDKLADLKMAEVDMFEAEDARGALMLTYSGSILTIGPIIDESRVVDYTSIGLRQDVPESANNANSMLSGDVEIDEVAEFSAGPIQKSSAIYKIAVTMEDLEPEEETELLSEATEILADEFVEINKTIIA